jgi:hypothetical protein
MSRIFVLIITCSFLDRFGCSRAHFGQEAYCDMWRISNRLYASLRVQQLQLEVGLLPVAVGLGCSCFSVAATGPAITNGRQCKFYQHQSGIIKLMQDRDLYLRIDVLRQCMSQTCQSINPMLQNCENICYLGIHHYGDGSISCVTAFQIF